VDAGQKTPTPMSVFNDRECQFSVIAHNQLIIPRDHRQCLRLALRNRREVRLDAFWRRPPWGDETALHPILAEFIKAVTARLAESPASIER
jgi:hypothetical protein